MKKMIGLILSCAVIAGMLAGCAGTPSGDEKAPEGTDELIYTGTRIQLSDDGVTVDEEQPADGRSAVSTGNDIVYYEAGHDFTYGEGTEADAHSPEEAAAHTVVHITKPGQYILSGKLSKGQIAVDLGEDAKEDPSAVVTLVLDGADITCEVAPAIIFYNVYECGSTDTETASATVDTSAAGANVIIADGSVNNISGAYVARIYKPGTLELSEDGTQVLDAKKLHKYDAAFYSKMSMNVNGGAAGDGVLNIKASNEGLDSELHLTVNGGNINIVSGNDGINTNEDGVSVTTVNGGSVNILVDGATGEGDGIDSNGWLVINGGSVIAQACAFSGDAGIDSDMGIHINGGSVFATGNMLDRIGDSKQTYAVFQFAGSQGGGVYTLKNSDNAVAAQQEITNGFMYLVIAGDALEAGEYTLWNGDTQLQGVSGQQMGGPGFMGDGGEWPEDMQPPEGMEKPEDMQPPEGMEAPGQMMPPDGETSPQMQEGAEHPEGQGGPMPGGRDPGDRGQPQTKGNGSTVFVIKEGENYFQAVAPVE